MHSPGDDTAPPRLPGLTPRSLILGVGLIVLCAYWVQKVSLISHTCQVAEGAPAVPALMGLLLLSGLAMLLKLRKGPVRQEILVIYIMLSLGVSLSADNVMKQLLPTLTSLRYFAGPENDFASFAQDVPSWLAIADDEVARQFCEGSDGGGVPWRAWAAPLAVWGTVFVGFIMGLYCLHALFRRPWADHEHLTYPLAQLAVDIAPGGEESSRHGHMLGQSLFWIGFALGALFDAGNIAHAFSPQLPAIGQGFDLSRLLNQQPWTGLRPLYLAFRPEITGLGYMVPLDILLSAWLFYLLLRVENLGAQLMGYNIPGFPFEAPQGLGAYIGIALMVLYTGRHHLRRVAQAALFGLKGDDSTEVLPHPVAFWGVVAAFGGLLLLFSGAGVSFGISLAYVGLAWVSALVYGRIRAQTGLPISYIVPREDMYSAIYELWPSPGRLSPAGQRQEVGFALLTVIDRMTFPQLGAFAMDGIRIGDLGNVRRGHVTTAVTTALVVGTLIAFWTHLTAAYDFGNNILDGGTTVGGYRTRQSVMAFETVQARATAPVGITLAPTIARGLGLSITLTLVVLRARFLRFPLHPLGLAIAATYGHQTWFPLFVVWLVKAIVLRVGGARLYRQLAAAFLGLAVGHMLIAGGVWGLVGAIDEDVAKRYLVWFA